MAEVNTRKRGTKWEYYFEAAKINGKRNKISKSGFRTKKVALEAGTKALAEYNYAGMHFIPSEISFHDYLDYWMKEYCIINLKDTTVANYKKKIKLHIKPELGKYKLKALTPAVLFPGTNTWRGQLPAVSAVVLLIQALSVRGLRGISGSRYAGAP